MAYTSNIADDNFLRYVGYSENNECIRSYFSQNTVNLISKKVTELLDGVIMNKKIVVTDRVITHVMSQIQNSYRPETGDIYSRYNIPQNSTTNYVKDMIDRTIEFIVSQISTEYGMIENNSKLNIWDTILGDFNKQGLRSHSILKTKERHPDYMQFNMNY